MAVVLGVTSLAGALDADPEPGAVMVVYLAMRLAYSLVSSIQRCEVRRVVGVFDRAITGGVAQNPAVQVVLLIMAFGSLFMVAGSGAASHSVRRRCGSRSTGESYTSTYLRFVWTLSAAVICATSCRLSSATATTVPGSRCR